MPVGKSSKKISGNVFAAVKDSVSRLDPMQSTIMLLGGSASACGIVPPMTQLLALMNGKSGKDVWDMASMLSPPLAIANFLSDMANPDTPTSLSPTEETMKILGLFCSGAVEACIMYSLVTNPATFKELITIPGKAIEGLGKMIPI